MNEQIMNKKWLIWSIEHRQWWKPCSQGYCHDILEAGRFTFKEATEIINHAHLGINFTAEWGTPPQEAMLPDPLE